MATDGQSRAAEAEPSSTHNTEISSLLSVKQDLSRLSSELSEGNSVMSVECEELTEADNDESSATSKPSDVADVTADETEDVELNDDDDDDEHLDDELQSDKSCDDATVESLGEPGDCHDCPSSHSEGDKFSSPSSSHCEDTVHTDELSDTKSKKASSLKRKSAEYTNVADNRRNSPVVKKPRHKTEVSPSQLLRTSSGTFVVHEVMHPGE